MWCGQTWSGLTNCLTPQSWLFSFNGLAWNDIFLLYHSNYPIVSCCFFTSETKYYTFLKFNSCYVSCWRMFTKGVSSYRLSYSNYKHTFPHRFLFTSLERNKIKTTQLCTLLIIVKQIVRHAEYLCMEGKFKLQLYLWIWQSTDPWHTFHKAEINFTT